MPRRSRSTTEEEEEEAAAAERANEVTLRPGQRVPRAVPPGGPTLQFLFEELHSLTGYLTVVNGKGLFLCSRRFRRLLSTIIAAHIFLSVEPPIGRTQRELMELKRAAIRRRVAVRVAPLSGPFKLRISVGMAELLVQRQNINKRLNKLVPMIKWEDVRNLRILCNNDLDVLDHMMYLEVASMGIDDFPVLLQEPAMFGNLVKLTLTVTQLATLDPSFVLPDVRCLKLLCRDAAFDYEVDETIQACFPKLNRLHLVLVPAGLLPFCGPGFQAPQDLRISLDSGSASEREANFFVASHLFELPFSWMGDFFRRVMRLQMVELSENHGGLSLESLAHVLQDMPHLRRLGTASLRTVALFDVTRESCKLEELVTVMEMDDFHRFFKMLMPIINSGKRSTLRRLAVHILASDGVPRPAPQVEDAICGGWWSVVDKIMSPTGCVVFSVSFQQIAETAMAQLPWFDPTRFSLDTTDYRNGRLPLSTSMWRPLPLYGTEEVEAPRGTLVVGPLRPSGPTDQDFHALAETHQLGETGPSSPSSPASPANRKRTTTIISTASQESIRDMPTGGRGTGTKGKKKGKHSWRSIPLVDAVETLLANDIKHKIQDMQAG